MENMCLCLYRHLACRLWVEGQWSYSDRAIVVVYYAFMVEIGLDLVMRCCIGFVEGAFKAQHIL